MCTLCNNEPAGTMVSNDMPAVDLPELTKGVMAYMRDILETYENSTETDIYKTCDNCQKKHYAYDGRC